MPETAETSNLEERIANETEGLSPEDLDGISESMAFRKATAKLLAGELTVPEWEWFVKRELNQLVDIPFVPEAVEKGIFDQALEVLGTALEGLLTGGSGQLDEVTGDPSFRSATLDLLAGKTTVPEWMSVVGRLLSERVDVPYVPEMAEDIAFEKGIELLGSALHGLLEDGSEDAS
jgi:hypothetical protein